MTVNGKGVTKLGAVIFAVLTLSILTATLFASTFATKSELEIYAKANKEFRDEMRSELRDFRVETRAALQDLLRHIVQSDKRKEDLR